MVVLPCLPAEWGRPCLCLLTATPANTAAPAVGGRLGDMGGTPHSCDAGVGWRCAPFPKVGWWLLWKEVRGPFRPHHGHPWILSRLSRQHPVLPGRVWAGSACPRQVTIQRNVNLWYEMKIANNFAYSSEISYTACLIFPSTGFYGCLAFHSALLEAYKKWTRWEPVIS